MSPRRLYLDNAATSFPKPRSVLDAMTNYATLVGASAGRGAYREAVESGAIISECRERIRKLINGESADHVVFTLNCTDALNLAIKGLVDPGASDKPHVICAASDHNSILRPIQEMARRKWVEQTCVSIDPKTSLIDPQDVRDAIRPNTKFVAIGHASNVTGAVQHIREIGEITRERGVRLIVDAAQSIGHIPIDVRRDNIDLLAAPGHKALLGPLGTGFLYVRPGIEKEMLTSREGGTGSNSEEPLQPAFMPDRFEAGSHNAIGISGLSEGVKWVLDQGIENVARHDRELVATFLEGIGDIADLKYFGPRGVKDRIGVFSVRIDSIEPHELSAILEASYGILTRSGIHCAPLIHQSIGTLETGGTTRFSFGPFTTPQDVAFAADALAQIVLSTQKAC